MKTFAVVCVVAVGVGFVLEREYRKYLADKETR